MKKYFLLILITSSISFIGCKENKTISGLWEIESVSVDNQTMTPIARWMQFNADGTQISGNGWYQHSYGNYEYDINSKTLRVENTNSIKDPYEAFTVKIENNRMYWTRLEDGNSVEVKLKRTDNLPKAPSDEIIGVWKLKTLEGDYNFFMKDSISLKNDYIFFRWDLKFVAGTSTGKEFGVYNVNAHKPELELIPYNKSLDRSFWKFEFDENILSLYLLNSDTLVTRKFIRTDEFPK